MKQWIEEKVDSDWITKLPEAHREILKQYMRIAIDYCKVLQSVDDDNAMRRMCATVDGFLKCCMLDGYIENACTTACNAYGFYVHEGAGASSAELVYVYLGAQKP